MTPANSWNKLVGLNSPKATLTFIPKESWWVPEVAVSFGKSLFTEDPRIGAADQLVETARSYQLVASKRFRNTELKVTHSDMKRKAPSMARSTPTPGCCPMSGRAAFDISPLPCARTFASDFCKRRLSKPTRAI